MVSPHPFYRPEPCSELAAHGIRRIYDRICRGRCHHAVRRSLLHSVSAGAAKTPYPLAPSSFPNCDRFTGSQFGHLEFYNAARDLDDGGQAAFCGYGKNQDFHTPQVQSKALVDGESREPSERFSGRLFLFFAVRHGSFLSPNRERKEWGRKTPLALHFPPCVLQ